MSNKKTQELTQKDVAKTAIRRMVFNAIIFLALMFLTFWFIFRDQDLGEILNVALNANSIFIVIGLLCMLGYFSMEAWNIKTLLNSFGEKVTFLQALKFTFIGFFFCSVTPGASGGQPLEIYYMTKDGVSGGNATMAILIQTCGVQFAVTTLGILCAVVGHGMLGGAVLWLFLLGLLINGVALAALLLCVFNTEGLRRFINWFMSFLVKHGVKSAENWRKSLDSGLNEYVESSKYIKSHQKEFSYSMAKVFVQMVLFFLIPYFVYKAFNLSGYNIFTLFTMQSILFVATCGLPLPGAIGASETVFLSLYGAVFGEGLLNSAMLLNRGISFYWFVVVSMVVVFINMILLDKISGRDKIKKKHRE